MKASSPTAVERMRAQGWRGSLAMLAVLLGGIAVCRLQVLTSVWSWDSGAWMYISQRLIEGATPYVDVWDNKLPPIFWIGVLYLKTGVPRAAMFVAEVGLTMFVALVLAALVRQAGMTRRWSLFFGGLFVCASMPVWEYPHRLETYALAALAPGVWLLVVGALKAGRGVRSCLIAGALLALTASLRPQQALDAVLLGGWLLFVGDRGRARRFVAYVAGGVTFSAALLLVAWARGYLRGMLGDAVLGSLDYASGDTTEAYTSLGATLWELRVNLFATPLIWTAFGLGGLLAAASWRSMGEARRALVSLAAVLFLSQFTCTFLAGHQLIHYHYPLGWSAALLAGVAVAASDLRVGVSEASQRWLAPLGAAVLFVTTAFPEADVYEGVQGLARPGRERPVDRLERLVRENIPRGEALYVLDDYSVAGVLTRLPNPAHDRWILFALQCHFFDPAAPPEGTTPYGVTSAERGHGFRQHIESAPPPWLVRQAGITDELSPWVAATYVEFASNGEFTVWRRASPEAR